MECFLKISCPGKNAPHPVEGAHRRLLRKKARQRGAIPAAGFFVAVKLFFYQRISCNSFATLVHASRWGLNPGVVKQFRFAYSEFLSI